MAALCTVTAATQPALMRFGATRLDPMLFAAGCAVVATLCVLPVVYARGELRLLVDRRYRMRLLTLSIIGTVVTTLTLIFGLRRIDAVAGTLLLQSEPVYSLLLATLFAGERPTLRQLAATAIIITGIVSAIGASSSAYSPAWAAMLVAGTPLLWQTSHVLSLPVMPPLSPLCMTAARYGYAAIVLTLALAVVNPHAVAQLRRPGRARNNRRDRRGLLFPRFAGLVCGDQPAVAGMDDRAGHSGHPAAVDPVRDCLPGRTRDPARPYRDTRIDLRRAVAGARRRGRTPRAGHSPPRRQRRSINR